MGEGGTGKVLSASRMGRRRAAQGGMILERPGVLWCRVGAEGLPAGTENLAGDNLWE